MSKAKKFYGAVFASIETKIPKNAGNVKAELDSIGSDFATLNACVDVTANQIGHGNKKTKVE